MFISMLKLGFYPFYTLYLDPQLCENNVVWWNYNLYCRLNEELPFEKKTVVCPSPSPRLDSCQLSWEDDLGK